MRSNVAVSAARSSAMASGLSALPSTARMTAESRATNCASTSTWAASASTSAARARNWPALLRLAACASSRSVRSSFHESASIFPAT
jgi:hypothetical protein